MEVCIIHFIIYLVGIIPAYLYFKYFVADQSGVWTVNLRTLGLFVALLSWSAVAGCTIAIIILPKINDESKKANW